MYDAKLFIESAVPVGAAARNLFTLLLLLLLLLPVVVVVVVVGTSVSSLILCAWEGLYAGRLVFTSAFNPALPVGAVGVEGIAKSTRLAVDVDDVLSFLSTPV